MGARVHLMGTHRQWMGAHAHLMGAHVQCSAGDAGAQPAKEAHWLAGLPEGGQADRQAGRWPGRQAGRQVARQAGKHAMPAGNTLTTRAWPAVTWAPGLARTSTTSPPMGAGTLRQGQAEA